MVSERRSIPLCFEQMGQSLDRKKSQLRRQLGIDRVLTTVQIERLGLTTAVEALDLPMLTLTSRTRITQEHSDVPLTYVALTPTLLHRPLRVLMHDAGTAEARRRSGLTGGNWQHASGKEQTILPLPLGGGRLRLPDAHYTLPQQNGVNDWAIEFDAGYTIQAIETKLRDADTVGYNHYLWATTVWARTGTIGPLIHNNIQRQGPLKSIRRVDVIYVNFWSRKDPYIQSSRNHKALRKTYTFGGEADE